MKNNFGNDFLKALGVTHKHVISISMDPITYKTVMPRLTLEILVDPAEIDNEKLKTVLQKYDLIPRTDDK